MEDKIGREPMGLPNDESVTSPLSARWGVLKRVVGIFLRPAETFRAIKTHPTWLIAFLLSAVFATAVQFVYLVRVPYPMRREVNFERIIKIARKSGISPQDEQELRKEYDRQTQRGETWLQKLVQLVYVPLNLLLTLLIGAGLYQLGALLVKERLAFKHALAVRAYAELPPTVIWSLFLIIQMYLRPPEEVAGYKGLLLGNLGFLVEEKDAHVALTTVASNLDLFQFWALAWAALGLSIMLEKATWGVAVGIAGGVWLLGLLVKVAINSLSGTVIV